MLDKSALAKLSVFHALSEEQIDAVRALMTERTVRAEEKIFEEGQHGDSLYVITEGEVEVTQRITEDVDNTLLSIGPGQVFGEMALVDPGERTASAKALTDTRLLVLVRKDFFDLALKDNALGIKIFLNLAILLTERLRQANEDHRLGMLWGIQISGAMQLNFGRLVADRVLVHVELVTGTQIEGSIVKVEQTQSGHEVTLLDGEQQFHIIPYHAIAAIRTGGGARSYS